MLGPCARPSRGTCRSFVGLRATNAGGFASTSSRGSLSGRCSRRRRSPMRRSQGRRRRLGSTRPPPPSSRMPCSAPARSCRSARAPRLRSPPRRSLPRPPLPRIRCRCCWQALALVSGGVMIASGVLRLGFIADFLSRPVLVGFVTGIAIDVIVGQLPKLLGVPSGTGHTLHKAWTLATDVPDTQWRTLAVGPRRARPAGRTAALRSLPARGADRRCGQHRREPRLRPRGEGRGRRQQPPVEPAGSCACRTSASAT